MNFFTVLLVKNSIIYGRMIFNGQHNIFETNSKQKWGNNGQLLLHLPPDKWNLSNADTNNIGHV
jgi:hypothetical protein